MSDADQLAIMATRFCEASKAQWGAIVFLAANKDLPPKKYDAAAKRLAELSDKGPESIKRGLRAVRYALDQGRSVDELLQQGEKKTRAMYVNGKVKARSAPLVAFPHRLTPEVRDALAELYLRLGKLLKLKTYDEVTEFIVADYLTTTDDEIVHRAGESSGDKTSSKSQTTIR